MVNIHLYDGVSNTNSFVITRGINRHYTDVTIETSDNHTSPSSQTFNSVIQIERTRYIEDSDFNKNGWEYEVKWNCPRLLPSSVNSETFNVKITFSKNGTNSKFLENNSITLFLNSPSFTYNIQDFHFKNNSITPTLDRSNITYFENSMEPNSGIVFDSTNGTISYNCNLNPSNKEFEVDMTITAFNSCNSCNSISKNYNFWITSYNSFDFSYSSILFTYYYSSLEFSPTFYFPNSTTDISDIKSY